MVTRDHCHVSLAVCGLLQQLQETHPTAHPVIVTVLPAFKGRGLDTAHLSGGRHHGAALERDPAHPPTSTATLYSSLSTKSAFRVTLEVWKCFLELSLVTQTMTVHAAQ